MIAGGDAGGRESIIGRKGLPGSGLVSLALGPRSCPNPNCADPNCKIPSNLFLPEAAKRRPS